MFCPSPEIVIFVLKSWLAIRESDQTRKILTEGFRDLLNDRGFILKSYGLVCTLSELPGYFFGSVL